jgi:hypothetical protein|tara:strand:- start:495 stop:620 length:126 start_codon:yes stop_codon:yes gene_type:complete
MTEMQKWRFRKHWDKWNVVYIMIATLVFFVGAIGLEAVGII